MNSILRSAADQATLLIKDTEDLLEAAGGKLGATRNHLQARLKRAGDGIADVQRELEYQGRRTVRRVDHYAHENPWRIAGAGIVAAVLIGMLIGSSLDRGNR